MLSSGDRLGRYVVVRRLGEGGMGQAYLCVRRGGQGVEQRVCVKVLIPALRGMTEPMAMFRREAALAASLRHPAIAGVVDVDDQQGFIAYEYIDGCDLRSMRGSALEPELVVFILAQVCRALEYAHNRRLHGAPSPVIHRDVSLSNLMADRFGNVKIIDFGIAKATQEFLFRTSNGKVKGKVAYMSPEQALGEALDGRSDQFSLGVVAYEMLSGVRPHDGRDEVDTHQRVVSGEHLALSERCPSLPSALCNVIERMLAVHPDARFPSMTAVLDALSVFTPPLVVYRALAARVDAAESPQTIMSASGKPISVPVVGGGPFSFDPANRAKAAGRGGGPSADARSLTALTAYPSVADARASRQRNAVPLSDGQRSSQRPRPALGWTAAGAMAALPILGLVAFWLFRPGPFQHALQPVPAAHEPSSAVPQVASPAVPDNPRAGPGMAVAADGGFSGQAVQRPPRATGAQVSSATVAGDRAPPAGRLEVRVVPEGNVWIDGHPYGRAPVRLQLFAGEHTVAVGTTDPARTRVVTVAAGGQHEVLIPLANEVEVPAAE